MIVLGLFILCGFFLNSICREATEQKTREMNDRHHNEILQLGTVSMEAEIQQAYHLGYQAAMTDVKKFDN